MTNRKYITLHAALLHIAFRGQPVPSNADAFAALERAARELQTMLEDGRVVAIGLKGRGPHQEIEDKFWVSAEFEAIADDEIDDTGNLNIYPDANTAWTKYSYCNETMLYKDVRVDRYMLEKLWPSLSHAGPVLASVKPKRITLKTERDAQYLGRIQEIMQIKGRLPTFKEDDEWRKREGLTQEIMRRLRAAHLPDEYKKGGRPKNLGNNSLVTELPS